MKTFTLSLLFIFSGLLLHAQSDSLTLSLSGYVDAYYARYNDMEGINFTTVSPVDNQIGLNIASLGLHIRSDNYRMNTVFHAGDIPIGTWAEGPYNLIQEANVGIKLGERFWIDGGFFTTHIGTESFLPKENFLSSTAVATYNEPFYQGGIRFSYTTKSDLDFEFWFLNGYNLFFDNNRAKSIGIRIAQNFNENTVFSYSNIIGSEQDIRFTNRQRFRTYHNLYFGSYSDDFDFIMGMDVGTQGNSSASTETAFMYNALLTMRAKFGDQFSLSSRSEIFNDQEGFISGEIAYPSGDKGLKVWGFTLGAEYKPSENSFMRIESRMLNELDKEPLFDKIGRPHQRLEIMFTMGAFINELEIWRRKR